MFARCWADDPSRRSNVDVVLESGETLEEARQRLQVKWNPRWLIEAGFEPWDGAGTSLVGNAPASVAGPVRWSPDIYLPRLDDQAPVTPKLVTAADRLREQYITAGEVAVLALWAKAASGCGITTSDIDLGLTAKGANAAGQARGARFNGALAYYLEKSLPGWRIETQVSIRDVFGLHLRSDVVRRSADVAIVTPSGRVMAFLSAKYSWRSDRGTEAALKWCSCSATAQDLPYVLLTAEFPRALGDLVNESIEDEVFHLCAAWVGAWSRAQTMADVGSALPTLADLGKAGRDAVPTGRLAGFDSVVKALSTAARYL